MKKFENLLVEKRAVPEGTTFEWYFGWDEGLDGHYETREGECTFPDGTKHHVGAERCCFNDYNTAWLID